MNGNGLHDQCTDTSGNNTFVACANVPPVLPGATVSAILDYAAGFCVTLNVTNATPTRANSWSVKVNNNQASIYDSWNGSFTASTGGTTIVAPNAGFNATLDPGETDASIGYCANRVVPGSALPTVVSTTATF